VHPGYRARVVFVTPNVARWTPTTEADLQQALDDGILEESHWWDAKRQLNPGPKVNKAFGQDLAAFAIDGGSLLIGLHEDKETGTFSLAPQPTVNMPERIGSIATSVVDPPLFVVTTVIPSEQTGEDGEALGYLLIEVPPSARAPHQVDGTYYGRGDKQNIRLSDAEVQRQYALRESLTHKGEALLAGEVARDPVPRAHRAGGHIYLVAEPLTAAPDVATRFLRDQNIQDWAYKAVSLDDLSIPWRDRDIPPTLQYLQRVESRSSGIAVTSPSVMGSGRKVNLREDDPHFSVDDGLLDIEFHRSGGIRALIGRATLKHPRYDEPWVLDQQVVHYARRLVLWVTRYADAVNYRGSWLLGVHVNGLDGAASSAFMDQFGSRVPPRYSEETYERVTTSTLQELVGQPWAAAARLVEDLVWSLGTADRHAGVLEAPVEG
jgi:hypothetical protein